MKLKPWLRCLLLLLILAHGACGGCRGDKEGENNKGVSEVDEGPYRDVLVGLCKTLDRCPDGLGYPIAYRSTAECVAILDFGISCRLTERELGNDASVYDLVRNTPIVNAAQAKACVDWLTAADCGSLIGAGEGSPCTTAFESDFDDDDSGGSAGVDEPCDGDYDCQSDLYCFSTAADADSAEVFCQVCRPRFAEGEPCAGGQYCAEGLGCHYVEDGAQVCAKPRADATRCFGSEECASGFCNFGLDGGTCDPKGNISDVCRDEGEPEGGTDCRPEYHCDAGACAPRREAGEACAAANECVFGLCDDTGVCGKANGVDCYDHGECTSLLCIDDLCADGASGACTADDQCAAGESCVGLCRPPNCSCSGGCPIGTCSAGGGGNPCEDNFDCGVGTCVDGQCSAVTTLGDSCSASYECYPLGYCAGGLCVEKHAPGASCTELDSCQEPFLCVDGRCEIMNLSCEPASAGQRCAFLRVCDENSYCDLLDSVTCKPRAAEGQECASSPFRGVETCRAGLTCTSDETGQKCTKRPQIGEACTGPCVEDAFCFEGICFGAPVGRPCGYDGPCPDGLVCNSDLEVCTPLGGELAGCDDSGECRDEFYCYSYRECQVRLGAGERCNDTDECSSELHCSRDSSSCEPDLQSGAMCNSSEQQCGEGFYCPRFGGSDSVCTSRLAPGSTCDDGEECLSGFCYSSDWCARSSSCTIPN